MSYKDYALANNSVINWRKSIDGYYPKGLNTFKDATTIRHMLDFCDDYLAKEDAMAEGVEDEEARNDFIQFFAEETAVMKEIQVELTAWLGDRNLPR